MAPLGIWRRARVLASCEVAPPAGGCVAAVPGRPGLFVPLGPAPGVPVAQWPIRTDEHDSGVTLGELEQAMDALLSPAPASVTDPEWSALGRYLAMRPAKG